jgi:hypothetical protein
MIFKTRDSLRPSIVNVFAFLSTAEMIPCYGTSNPFGLCLTGEPVGDGWEAAGELVAWEIA